MSKLKINNYGDWESRNEEGQYHREDGPAYKSQNGYKSWFINGKRHRIDGPAVEYEFGHKEYYINDIRYNSLEEGLMDQALK